MIHRGCAVPNQYKGVSPMRRTYPRARDFSPYGTVIHCSMRIRLYQPLVPVSATPKSIACDHPL